MAQDSATTGRGRKAVASAAVLVLFAAQAQERKDGGTTNGAKPSTVVGAWKATERHEAHGSLYQPVHIARKRDALVYFEQDGGRLTGRSETADYKEITGQSNWNGRTTFDRVRFADGTLTFEIDITDWNPKLAPLSRELTGTTHKGTVRVDAQLQGDKLTGKWGIVTKDGVEVFRGEWEAVRVSGPEKK
jgi:hypothetical protein